MQDYGINFRKFSNFLCYGRPFICNLYVLRFISAIVLQRWNRLVEDMRDEAELILHANYVKVNNEEQSYINITPAQVEYR